MTKKAKLPSVSDLTRLVKAVKADIRDEYRAWIQTNVSEVSAELRSGDPIEEILDYMCRKLEMSRTSTQPLNPWITTAAPAPATSGVSSARLRLPITSSIRNLVAPGSTSPANRMSPAPGR